MTYSLTVFRSPRWWEKEQRFVYDNKTHRRMDFDSWDKFTSFLGQLSKQPKQGKQDAELISPAIYQPDSPRRNVNVVGWAGWAAIDVDDWQPEGDLEDAINNTFGMYRFVCYSTASSTTAQPKFRIVFSLTKDIDAERIRPFWFALQSEFNEMGDKQCKDLSRMYYVPGQYAGAYNFFIRNDNGRDVDVDGLLHKYPYNNRQHSKSFLNRLPDAWREQIIEHRKSALEDTSYVWNDYRDCPFIDRKQVAEYVSIANQDGSGRYRMIYKIMVVTAMNAVRKKYPMSADQLVTLIRQLDADTANIYQSRPLDVEANNALQYAYTNTMVE